MRQLHWDTLMDLQGARRHSRYFSHSRADYLIRLLRTIALVLCVAMPLWIMADWFLLPAEVFWPVVIARLLCSALCLAIVLARLPWYRLSVAFCLMASIVGVLSLFYVVCIMLLHQHGLNGSVAGYQFFPAMIMVMIAVFPLTIEETVAYVLFVLGVESAIQVVLGEWGTITGINGMWLLVVLAMVAGWSAINHLSMLLRMYRQATRDPLTGLSNRRQAAGQMETDIERAREKGIPFSVLLFDIDKFKRFNDTYGHAVGDIVLKVFARILQKHSRKKLDMACRYGGEEFLMVLPGMDVHEAAEVAEKVRCACHAAEIEAPSKEKICFSTSAGVAQLREKDSLDELLNRVDEALYHAKDSGRDQVQLAEAG